MAAFLLVCAGTATFGALVFLTAREHHRRRQHAAAAAGQFVIARVAEDALRRADRSAIVLLLIALIAALGACVDGAL